MGPLERKTKQNLCTRALNDYQMIEKFNQERIEPWDLAQTKASEKEHPAIRVAKQYKSKEFMTHARNQLAKEPQSLLQLNRTKKSSVQEERRSYRK